MCDIIREETIGEIKKSIEGKMKKLFDLAHKYAENLSHEDIERLHENHVKDVFYPYINSIPFLHKKISEIGEEKVLEELKTKFIENYRFHKKMVKCEAFSKNRETKYTEKELLEKDTELSEYIRDIVTSIINECKDLNIEEIKEIHMFIFKLIFNSDIEHIPCFKKASETMNMDVVNKIHDRKVTETINNYMSIYEKK